MAWWIHIWNFWFQTLSVCGEEVRREVGQGVYVAGGGRLWVTQSARKSYFCVVGKYSKMSWEHWRENMLFSLQARLYRPVTCCSSPKDSLNKLLCVSSLFRLILWWEKAHSPTTTCQMVVFVLDKRIPHRRNTVNNIVTAPCDQWRANSEAFGNVCQSRVQQAA